MIKAIIFDFDNTLNDWDNVQPVAELHIANMVSGHHRLKPRHFLEYLNIVRKRYYGHRLPKIAYNRELWFREVFKHLKVKNSVNRAVEDYWAIGTEKTKLFPGVKRVLDTLKKKYKIAMLSDSDGDRKYKIRRVKKLGIYSYFDLVVPTDDIGVNKPRIECFRYVARKLGVKPSECVMVGDHPEIDLINAKKAGMTTVWTHQAYRRPAKFKYVDFEIDKIQQVLEVIKKIDKPVKNTKRKAKK